MSSQISEFIDDIKNCNVLKEEEITNHLGQKSILKSLNYISETAMSRLVFELCSDDFKLLLKKNYFEIDIEKFFEEVNLKLEAFIEYMHFSTQKKYWSEVIKSTVFSYTKCVFSANMSGKKTSDLINKLENDKDSFINCCTTLGKNQLEEETRILTLIKEFLSSDIDVLSFTCSNIRANSGKTFTQATAVSLINLRSDLSKNDKNEAINTCKDVLANLDNKTSTKNSQNDIHNEFFRQLHIDLIEETKKEESSISMDKENEKDLKDVDSVLNKQERRKTINLDSFLADLEDDEQGSENNDDCKSVKSDTSSEFKRSNTKTKEELTEIIKQGMMKKKSSNTWQERFFQLKNKKLYWYQNKESNLALNYIDLKDVLKMPFSHKPLKFTIPSDKEYKFECLTQDETEEWIDAIKNEMLKIKNSNKLVQIYQAETKKKIITLQGISLPNIFSYKATMKNKIIDSMKKENYFPSKKK